VKKFNTIDQKEILAASLTVQEAADNHSPLSGYIGSSSFGGTWCTVLEASWRETFGIKHAVAVNSGTSGLLAACMAVGVEHNNEVIVSPYTMSATAAAPKVLGAKIVFADIEPETFTIDPVEVSNAITPKTKAVIATNLFGHPAQLRELRDICDNRGVYLIEDNAQAIFAKEDGIYTGTIGHIGVFSLNVHKHLQVGEGGVCVTNDSGLAKKMREAMNHGEMRGGILGLNLRMTEVTAAMAYEQLKKAPEIMTRRRHTAEMITSHMAELPVNVPVVRPGCEHSYYCWAGLLDEAVRGPLPEPFKAGYVKPLWSLDAFKGTGSRPAGNVVEDIERRIILVEICSIDPTDEEIIEMVEKLGRVL